MKIGEFEIKHFINSIECYDEVKYICEHYFSVYDRDSKANYLFTEDDIETHTVGYILKNNGFVGFTIVYKNEVPVAIGGIRKHEDKVSIIASRALCFATSDLILHKILIPFHLSISREMGFERCIVSFNEYNRKIYDLWERLLKTKSPVDFDFGVDISAYEKMGIHNINNVNQYVISWTL